MRDAFFAALLEARGAVGTERSSKTKTGTSRRAQLTMPVPSESAATAALEHFEAGSIKHEPYVRPTATLEQWIWRVQGLAALDVLERVEPYISGGMAPKALGILARLAEVPPVYTSADLFSAYSLRDSDSDDDRDAYCAGLLESRGRFGIGKAAAREGKVPEPFLNIGHREKYLAGVVQDYLGGGEITETLSTKKGRTRTHWVWKLRGAEALGALERMRGHMLDKSARYADCLLERDYPGIPEESPYETPELDEVARAS